MLLMITTEKKEGMELLDEVMDCVLQGTFFEPVCVVPRTGALGTTKLHRTDQPEIPAQVPLSSTQLPPLLIHLSNLKQNIPSDCLTEWDSV